MRLRLDLDPKTSEALSRAAAEELRPVQWQAEMIIRRQLGTDRGQPQPETTDTQTDEAEANRDVA